MKKIYHYSDYRTFLREFLSDKKREAGYYSLRNISARAGLKSSGHLSMILKGERNLSPDIAEKLSPLLHLQGREKEYFLNLVQFNQAKRTQEKEKLYSLLKKCTPVEIRTIDDSQGEFYDQWYYSAIREMLAIYIVHEDNAAELAKKLAPAITEAKFRKGLKVLLKTGLALKNSDGIYCRQDQLLTSNKEMRRFYLNKFNRETMALGLDSIDRFSPGIREVSTVTMSIDKKTYQEIIRRTAQFRGEIMALATQCSDAKAIYQLNMQLFPLMIPQEGNDA